LADQTSHKHQGRSDGGQAMKRGRKKGSGVLSGIPPNESWTDIRNRTIYDSPEWPLLKLRALIGDATLPDNYLSAQSAAHNEKLLKHVQKRKAIFAKYRSAKMRLRHLRDNPLPLMPPILSAWTTLLAGFERAVLDGDADWSMRQAKALGSVRQQEHSRFNAAVVRAIEEAYWEQRAAHHKGKRKQASATLSPAGKFINATKQQIYRRMPVEACRGLLLDKSRAHEAIDKIAKKLRVTLKEEE
jgi:hypothetical protein